MHAEEEEEDRPATLAKSQDAAAARAEGEQIGETGKPDAAIPCHCRLPPVAKGHLLRSRSRLQ